MSKPPPLVDGYPTSNSLGARVRDIDYEEGANTVSVRFITGGLVIPVDDDFTTNENDRDLVAFYDVEYNLEDFDDSVLADDTGDDYDYAYIVDAPTVVHFFSENFTPRRIYFVYPVAGDKTGVASCEATENGACNYSISDFEYTRIDRRSTNFVYDQLQLVRFKEYLGPVIISPSYMNIYRYGLFTEETVSPVSVLSDPSNLYINADPRNNLAYNMKPDGDGGYILNRGSIDPSGDVVLAAYVITLKASELEEIFEQTPIVTNPADFVTTTQQTSLVNGNMFDIVAKNTVVVTGISLHIASTDTHEVQIWLRKGNGSFETVQRHPGAWEAHAVTQIAGAGAGVLTSIPKADFNEFTILKGDNKGFYVRTAEGSLLGETKASATGTVYGSNADLTYYVGVGKPSYFSGSVHSDMIWNGGLSYTVATSNTNTDVDPVKSGSESRHIDFKFSLLLLTISVLGIGMISSAPF